MVYKSGQISLRFVRDHACDRQTDRQTEFSSLDRVCITCSAVVIKHHRQAHISQNFYFRRLFPITCKFPGFFHVIQVGGHPVFNISIAGSIWTDVTSNAVSSHGVKCAYVLKPSITSISKVYKY